MHYLNLIRWKDLLLLVLSQTLIKYALLEPLKDYYSIDLALNSFQFFLLVLASVCIAAAGNVINAVENVVADKVNSPEELIIGTYISEKNATNLFIGLNFVGVVTGFFLTKAIDKTELFPLFIIASALLYIYSTFLNRYILVGKVVIAALVALSIFAVGLFDLIPVLTKLNASSQYFFLDLIKDYAIFAFMITLLRQMVIDIKNIDGNYKMGIQSLSIILGRERVTKLVFVLSLIPLLIVIFYLSNNLYKQPVALIYVLILIVAPLIYVTIKLFSAEQKNHYRHISKVLKITLLTSALSLLLFQFILIK